MNDSLAYLVQDAHQIAIDKGFWKSNVSKSATATKVALIHTEIDEFFLAAVVNLDSANAQEELADIVIRAADLVAALDAPVGALKALDLSERPPRTSINEDNQVRAMSLELHHYAASVTQADRKDEPEQVQYHLLQLISRCFFHSWVLGFGDLWPTIHAKMAKNRERPTRHGRKY